MKRQPAPDVLRLADSLRSLAKELLERTKSERDEITVEQARELTSTMREVEGWLLSIRKAVRSEGGI